MTALREAIRQIGSDLIAKRLWPVAVALLAAIVVVPMLIGASSSDEGAAAPVTGARPPAAGPAVADPGADGGAEPVPSGHARAAAGAVRDPFYAPPKAPATPRDDAAGGATRAVADPPGPSNPSSPSSPSKPSAAGQGAASTKRKPAAKTAPSTSTTPTPTPAPSPSPKPAPSPVPTHSVAVPGPAYYRAVVRWGSSADAAPHAIARLTPLGGRRNPAALYLGVTKPGTTHAIFVLGAHATSHGDGRCRTGTQCRMIALRPGDTRRFTVRSPADGTVRRFTLRLRSLKSVETTASAALRGRSREHPDGREVLYAMWRSPALAEVLAWASYDRSSGLLRPAADRGAAEKPAL